MSVLLRIVIPVYGQWELLAVALESIEIARARATAAGVVTQVHVLDNGSFTPPPDDLQRWMDERLWIMYERWETNRGVTRPWNYGLHAAIADAQADVVCICNSDVVFGPRVIEQCVEAVTQRGHGYACPRSIRGGPLPANWSAQNEALEGAPFEAVGGMQGWCFFLPRTTVEKVGYFDERFTLWYQDTQYHMRVAEAGLHLAEVWSCLLHHFESRTILSMPQQFECHGWRARDTLAWNSWLAQWTACQPGDKHMCHVPYPGDRP